MQLDDSKLIFQQLAHVDANTDSGTVVRVMIENHDAWLHNRFAFAQLSAAVREQLPAAVADRVALQQSRLQSLALTRPLL